MSFTFTADELSKLSTAQKTQIVDVVIAGVLADGTVDDKEVEKFDSEFRKVPWGLPESEMIEIIKTSFKKIQGFNQPDQALNLVREAATTLTDATIREKTFALLAVVMYADKKMTSNELTVLQVFATAFEIPRPRLEAIAATVKN